MKKTIVNLIVNGEEVQAACYPAATLLQVLREELELTGAKEGCGEGACGSCTVLLDGKPVRGCLTIAQEVEGRNITTIEGLADGENLSPLQQAFVKHGAIQCGFCSPGMILVATSLLAENPTPTEEEIRSAISGATCRCTGYAKIVEAIMSVSEAQ